MTEIVMSIGSNCGDRRMNVEKAIGWLSAMLEKPEISSIYETPEIHGREETYMNAVIRGKDEGEMADFDMLLKSYELENGRTPVARMKGEVPIDIDIVIWDGEIVRPRDYAHEFFQIGFREINA